jgi:RNA polymerase sigma-70 factor (ECF subfamily)
MASELEVRDSLARGSLDAAAVAALELYGNPLLGYLVSLLRDEETARDVFSQFAEDLWRGLPKFRGECSLRAWCYRLAWHAAARHLRDPWRRRAQPLTSLKLSALVQSIGTSGLAPGSRRSLLAELREQLTHEEETLLALRIDRELEWEEVAHVLSADGEQASPDALRKRYERLRQKLGQMARDAGLLDEP